MSNFLILGLETSISQNIRKCKKFFKGKILRLEPEVHQVALYVTTDNRYTSLKQFVLRRIFCRTIDTLVKTSVSTFCRTINTLVQSSML